MTLASGIMPEYIKIRLEIKRLRKCSSGKRKERAKIQIEIPLYAYWSCTIISHAINQDVINDLNNISFYLGRV